MKVKHTQQALWLFIAAIAIIVFHSVAKSTFWKSIWIIACLIISYNLMGIVVAERMPKKVKPLIKKDPRKAIWNFVWINISSLLMQFLVFLLFKMPINATVLFAANILSPLIIWIYFRLKNIEDIPLPQIRYAVWSGIAVTLIIQLSNHFFL